jgi:Zn-dependent peptidase ImmA (M78 family)/transcriptional regulator with XRE-family HTH domain
MSLDSKELGRRFRKIRENHGFTQQDLAGLLGIPRPAVVQIEAGNRSLDSVELMKLAKELGFDPKDLFVEVFREDQDSVTVLFRTDPEMVSNHQLNQAVSHWSVLCRQFTELEKLVGADRKFVSPALYELPFPGNKWEAIQQGNIIADYERGRLKLGTAPLPDLPEIIEGQGVRVGRLPLEDCISGLFLADDKNGLAILVNAEHSEQRQLFSYAHEYGHLLFDRKEKATISRRAEREKLNEIRANSFAAALLLPEEGVREFLVRVGKSRELSQIQEVYDEEGESVRAQRRTAAEPFSVQFYDVVHLAFYFGVSYEAALWRLKSLQIISEEEREDLLSQNEAALEFRKLLWRQSGRRQRIQGGKFQHKLLMLALEAYRLGEISKAKLREIGATLDVTSRQIDAFTIGSESADSAELPLLPN